MQQERAWRPKVALEALWIAPFVIGYAAFGLYTARLGFAVDTDSRAIWRAAGVILDGHYRPSRTSGFPAYEIFVAVLRGLGADVVTVAAASVAIGLAAFALALSCTGRGAPRLAVAVLFCASPVIVTNAAALMETNLTLLTVTLLLRIHLRLTALDGDPGPRLALMAGLAGWAVVLSRLDAAIVVTASNLALFAVRRRPVYLAILAGAGAASFLSYWLLRGDLGFLGIFRTAHDPVARSVAKAAVGAAAVLWTAGGAAVAALILNRRRLEPEVRVMLLLGTGLYAVRFGILADEVEYLLPIYMVAIVLAARTVTWGQLRWMAPSAAAGMLATPLLFDKPIAESDGYRIVPTLGPPAIVQDLRRQAELNIEKSDEYWHWLEGQVGTPLRYQNNGFVRSRDGHTVVVFEDGAHAFTSPRWQHFQPLTAFDRVILCAGARRQNLGWRQLRLPERSTAVDEFSAGRSLRCESLAGPVDPDRFRLAARRIWPDPQGPGATVFR